MEYLIGFAIALAAMLYAVVIVGSLRQNGMVTKKGGDLK
jgi:hypothetical protein